MIDGEMDMEDLKERQELSIKATDADQDHEDDGCSFHITSDKQRRGGEINCALRLNSVSGNWEIIENITKNLRELRDAINLDQFKGQQELADCLKTNQSSISRRINQAVQMGLLTHERIKESYKLAKEKEIEFDEDDF